MSTAISSDHKGEAAANQLAAVRAGARHWGIGTAFIVVLLCYVLTQLVGAVLLGVLPSLLFGWTAQRTQHWLTHGVFAQFLYIAIVEGLTVLLLVAFARWRKAIFRQVVGFFRWPKLSDVAYALMGFGAYLVIYIGVASLASILTPIDLGQKQATGFEDGVHGLWPHLIVFVSLVVLPPIVEEMTFRGFLFGSLRGRLRFVPTTIIVSLIFGSLHLLTGVSGLLWIAALDTFVLSVVLCTLREKTGNIYATILVHALKNCLAFVSLFIIGAK